MQLYANGNDEFVCHLDPGGEHVEDARPDKWLGESSGFPLGHSPTSPLLTIREKVLTAPAGMHDLRRNLQMNGRNVIHKSITSKVLRLSPEMRRFTCNNSKRLGGFILGKICRKEPTRPRPGKAAGK